MSILANSNAIESGGYNLSNSLRFRASASAYLNRTPASAGNRRTWTWSGWVKRGQLGVLRPLFYADTGSSPLGGFNFSSSDTLQWYDYVAPTDYGSVTTAVYRDPSAWYHIVLAVDTTQASASNRIKLYVNGVQQTFNQNYGDMPQNYDTAINSTIPHYIGRETGLVGTTYDGYLTEINFIDGQALTPSSFGATDATTGVWQPKKYTGTYGTNGFYLPFKNVASSTSSSFSSYYGTFDNSAKYLSLAGNTAFAFGTGDFCVEAFVTCYSPSTTEQCIVTMATSAAGDTAWDFNIINGTLYFGGWTTVISAPFTVPYGFCHLVACRASGVLSIYANGTRIATGSHTLNYTNTSNTITIGRRIAATALNGLISNLRIVKGSSVYTPSSATLTVPTSALTAISGTSLLTLQNATIVDNSTNAFTITNNGTVTTTSGNINSNYTSIASDFSGNANNFTPNNINYLTSGTTYDSMTDVPTLTSATAANYAVLNPIGSVKSVSNLSQGNLLSSSTSSTIAEGAVGTISMSSGKWYWEVTVTTTPYSKYPYIGIIPDTTWVTNSSGNVTTSNYSYNADGNKVTLGTFSAYGASFTTNDVIGVAFDAGAGTLTFYKNNVSQGTAFTGLSGSFLPYLSVFNTSATGAAAINFGQRPFTYTPPTGYVALNTYNLPTPTILKGNKYMDATTYTGNSSTQSITNAGTFKPDLVWLKCRSTAGTWNNLIDSVRGASKTLYSNTTNTEGTDNYLSAFNSNGFALNVGDSGTNTSGNTYVGWQWQAGQGSTSSNTNGYITSTVSVNATAGFSVVTYTGNLTASPSGGNDTVGHGLGVTPSMIIFKRRDGTSPWIVWHKSLTNASYVLQLNTTDAQINSATAAGWLGGTVSNPTSTTFGTNYITGRNVSGQTQVAYCWAEITGFSKFGSYTGNGSADGPFVYCGFRPKFLMIKTTNVVNEWIIVDSARATYNVIGNYLLASTSGAEGSGFVLVDFVSNGFKMRNTYGGWNGSGENIIYAAFAENPFKNALAR